MYVVEHDWHAVARSFSESDIAWDDSFEDLRSEKASKIGCDLLGQRCSIVIHREENAFNRQGWIDRAPEAHEGIE
jgi:hypothetical protein